jgi:DNA-binding transcriptional regulator LsrR (DeoR family)
MAYLNNLTWQTELSSFDEQTQKVLLALSSEKFSWRTKERIVQTTGISEPVVDELLSMLMSQNLVRASISKKKNVIFGLIERVGS